MKLKRQSDAREFEVELLAQHKQDDADAGGPRAVRITIDGREVAATVAPMPDGSAMVELAGGFGYGHADASFTGPGGACASRARGCDPR